MRINKRFETLNGVAPLPTAGATMFAGRDLAQPLDHPAAHCTIKLYHTPPMDQLIEKYFTNAFRREAESLRRLAHRGGPNGPVIRFREGGLAEIEENGEPNRTAHFVVWESTRESEDPFVSCSFRVGMEETRKKLLSRQKEKRFTSIILQNLAFLARGLTEIHQHDIIHRNITPGTLIYHRGAAAEPRLRIGHFDMSYLYGSQLKLPHSRGVIFPNSGCGFQAALVLACHAVPRIFSSCAFL